MVLEEVEKAASDSQTDSYGSTAASDTISSDHSDNQGPIHNWTLENIKTLVSQSHAYPNPFTPIPWYTKLLGWNERVRDKGVVDNVNRTQIYVARQLTPTEVHAESYYHSEILRILYNSEAIGLVSFLGLAYLRQTAGKPGLVTPYARRYMGDKTGDVYIMLSRYLVYGYFGRLQGQLLGAIVGANRMKTVMRTDPNVQHLRRDLQEFRIWSEDEIKRRAQNRRRGSPEPLIPTAEEIKNRYHPSHQNQPRAPDEGSTTEGDYILPSSERDHHSREVSPGNSKQPPTPEASPTQASDDPLYGFVSSPSGGPLDQLGSPVSSKESAWERLRRQQQSGQSTSNEGKTSPWAAARQTRPDDPRAPKTDSFTFSASDQERQLAQAEAQREFDARLERERRGASDRGFVRAGSDQSMIGGDYSGERSGGRDL